MKTIKHGNRELLKKYKYFECSRCGWVGKAEEGEYQSDTQYNTTYSWVKCPICLNRAGEIIDINTLEEIKKLEQENDKAEMNYYKEYPMGR